MVHYDNEEVPYLYAVCMYVGYMYPERAAQQLCTCMYLLAGPLSMAGALADSSVKTHCLPWTSVLRRAAPAARLPERRERLGSHGCP